ncbi:hypothetical protein BJF93_04900 [Xaviernesmea oryzae]|uniref:histidine kinase n=1 Tax=Xaviernesmea oryzae TaxID=464029 RepID=A0A1Q9AUV4_9HYPH|nr:ATP-binding protein [Xaviernesmea oryzae]OLP59236.1 hypothetical protein BJF93_04900 [Xaviernesmea oryzae]SEK80481.1 Response regulator receiver domain-containing protein [Xaviernesmea oryzae]
MSARLVATVAHELRTPLAGILGMGHLLSETPLNAEQRNYLTQMRDSAGALGRLVDDLLDMSALAAGRFELSESPVEIRVLIEQVVEMLAHRAHAKGIEIASTVDAAVPDHLLLDSARLRQVLFNIAGNAVKFTREGGVLVSASWDAGTLVIAVRDSGLGIDEADREHLFTAFERGAAGRQTSESTGLGLSIARRIVEAFGGTLTFESQLGTGSTFFIRLPGHADSAESRTGSGPLSASHVLVIAPDGPAREGLAATIATLGGRCRLAATAQEARAALAWFAAEGPALTDVIVDHRLSGTFRALLAESPDLALADLRRTYLVNPEERSVRPINRRDGYRSWLVRPLRERSLIEVMTGRMQGIEVRDAINDNRAVFRAAPSPPLAAANASAAPPGILVAEDDAVQAMLLSTLLRKTGHAVHVVSDAPELLAALAPGAVLPIRPVLVLTDLHMPGGSGVALVRRIRAEMMAARRSPLPLVVQTADDSAKLRAALGGEGVAAVLIKPADGEQLAALVQHLLDAEAR